MREKITTLYQKVEYNVFKLYNDAYTNIKSIVSHRTADPPVQELMLQTKPLNFPNKLPNKRPN